MVTNSLSQETEYDHIQEAQRFYRSKKNRKCNFGYDKVITDTKGNILHRPLVRAPELKCFGDPHDYYLGISDTPHSWTRQGKVIENPHGCAGCRVRAACGFVVQERIDSSPALGTALASWELATSRIGIKARYADPTWATFAIQCRQHSWSDSHVVRLAEYKADEAAKKRVRDKLRRKALKRLKRVDPGELDAIETEGERRAAELKLKRLNPSAPPYIRRLNDAGCQRTADVWAERKIMKRTGMKPTARAIAERLQCRDPYRGMPLPSLATRVNETFVRIDRLEIDGIWGPFKWRRPNALTP